MKRLLSDGTMVEVDNVLTTPQAAAGNGAKRQRMEPRQHEVDCNGDTGRHQQQQEGPSWSVSTADVPKFCIAKDMGNFEEWKRKLRAFEELAGKSGFSGI